MRIALGMEYDGSDYHGWQAQTGLHTVQSVLENALSRVADTKVSVICAGRTDTGVHATHQVVHFDCESVRVARAWVYGVNSFLPKNIAVLWAKEMPDTFHARYSALARRYRYVIYNAPIRPALFRANLTWQYRPLEEKVMHQAGQCLMGEHDYTSFRSVECQSRSPTRRISTLKVWREGDLVVIDISANAFLHHMVRNIAGVLMSVGSGKQPMGWVQEVLQAKDRRLGAETASPYGLYLVKVTYPKEYGIGQGSIGPLFLKEHFFKRRV